MARHPEQRSFPRLPTWYAAGQFGRDTFIVMLRREAMQFAGAAAVLAVLPSLAIAQRPSLSVVEIRDIAESAYIFAYPLVLLEFTRKGAPTNVFRHFAEFPSASFRTVVRPNVDTLYSNAWLDLSKEPILLHVPDTGGRYYVMQLMDAWTETLAAPGKRTTGTGEGWFAIVGPDWRGKLPAGVRKLDATTNAVWLLARTQTNTAADYENVRRIQAGFTLTPLSRYPGDLLSPASAAPPSGADSLPPPARLAQLSAVEYFREFQQLLVQNPAHAADTPMMRRLARLGIEAGKPFEPERLGADGVKALEEGARAAAKNLTATNSGTGKNGWIGLGTAVGRFGTDYRVRAQVARIGLGTLPPDDAIYLGCMVDQEGRPLEGASHYKLHFSSGNLPPVQAFWSVTLYDPAGFFFANPLERYAIGDRDSIEPNPDGSLDLYIQHDAPGGNKDRNWLPAPEGGFNLLLRMYWPKKEALKGRWNPPAVMRQP
jgi:hypothetical protein